jgi:hypothetical protein
MPIANSSNPNINVMSDNTDYKDAFYYQTIKLLTAGYNILLKSESNYAEDEEEITGELVKCIKEFIDCSSSPEWVIPYSVYEEARENTEGRKGKKRKRVDIVCELTQKRPHQHIKFEAKRLKVGSHPENLYIGSEGLGEFISGAYAPESLVGGMLGYVQSNSCNFWANKIAAKLNIEKLSTILKDIWRKSDFINIEHCYKTKHGRKNNLPEIFIFHLLLDFTSQSIDSDTGN